MEPQAYGTPADYVVIVVYMIFIFGIGAYLARFNRSTKDFFMGGQRFGWWVIAMSLVATTVGSYSFVKYSAAAYSHGLGASMSYLNDWFWMPLFMFVWLPIIYFGRIRSVPEYFERRFGRSARLMSTILLLLYMLGAIGINLYTMGKVAAQLLGYTQTLGPVFLAALIIAIFCAAYVASGGQAAVILSDVLQGALLLFAGLGLCAAGIYYLGGFDQFWAGLTPAQRLPLAPLNEPPGFNFIGVFWQDAVTNGVWVYFLNQGIMLRFMSGRSADTGRKAAIAVLMLLQVLAVLAVAGAGWIGRAMVNLGLLPDGTPPDEIFMVVANILASPGVFGFVLAALTAALMSTADTLINATASVWVNDVWRLYVKPDAPDTYHLKVARIASVAAAGVGLVLVPIYLQVGTIYQAHGAFTAAIGPPLAVALVLGLVWKRYTATAAFWTMLGGIIAISITFVVPELISPLAMGVEMDPNPWKAYTFQRALFGLVVSLAIGVPLTFFTKARRSEDLIGLVVGTLDAARRTFKGKDTVNEEASPAVKLTVTVVEREEIQTIEPDSDNPLQRFHVFATADLLKRLEAEPGDLLTIKDARFFMGDLRGTHGIVQEAPGEMEIGETLGVPAALLTDAQLDGDRPVAVRRIL